MSPREIIEVDRRIDFGVWLTGHDEATVWQMYEDYHQGDGGHKMKTAEGHNGIRIFAGLTGSIEDDPPNAVNPVLRSAGGKVELGVEANAVDALAIAFSAYDNTIDALIKMGEDKDAEIAALKSRIAELEKQLEGKEDEQGR